LPAWGEGENEIPGKECNANRGKVSVVVEKDDRCSCTVGKKSKPKRKSKVLGFWGGGKKKDVFANVARGNQDSKTEKRVPREGRTDCPASNVRQFRGKKKKNIRELMIFTWGGKGELVNLGEDEASSSI